MKLKTLLVLVLTTFVLSLSAETAYQKKTYQIYEKYYTLFKDGYSHNLTMAEAVMFSADPEAMTTVAVMSALEWQPINKIDQYIKQMEKELKQAESLMTPEERKKKAEKEAMESRRNTSAGCLELAIQTELIQWADKGEFEKTADYQKRLQEDGSTQFAAVCNKRFPRVTFDVKPLQYDADKEKYDFQIQYKIKFEDKSFSHDIKVAIPIDVEDARYLSENKPSLIIIDCVWGVLDNNLTPQSCKIKINGKYYAVTTKATDLIVKGSELVPDIVELGLLQYNYTAQRQQRVEQKAQLIKEIEQYNIQKEEQCATIKRIMVSSPYYKKVPAYKQQELMALVNNSTTYFTYDDDISIIDEYYNNMHTYASDTINCKNLLLSIKQYLKSNDKQKYVEAFIEENPDSALILKQEWQEYKCNYDYKVFDDFVIAYQERKLDPSLRNCKEKAWNMYGKYYNSRDEFDSDYEAGEIALKNRKDLCESLEGKVRGIHEYLNLGENKKISTMSLQGAYENHNEFIKEIVELYNELSAYPAYQEKAASVIIEESEKTQKEYVKNGNLFTSKAEFIKAYFNPNYKKILKLKK